jgi:hypothetical protein
MDELEAIVQRMIDAGESEENIAAVIKEYHAQPAPAAPSMADSLLADNPNLPWMARGGQAIARFAKNKPATAGAIAGGLAVAPFTGGASVPAAMAMSGLGSAGGAGLGLIAEQMGTGRPKAAGDVAKEMAIQGATGAAGEGIGRGLVTVAGKVAPHLARAILKPSKALQREYGQDELIESFLKEGVPVGQSATVGGRAKASAATADQMLADAQAAGAGPVSIRPVAAEMRPLMDKAQTRVRLGQADESPSIVGRIRAMRGANPQGIPLTVAQEMKREAQGQATRAFRAADAGTVVNDMGAHTDKAVATGLKHGIEARVPAVKDVNANTQRLMGLEEALADAESRSPGFMGTNPMTWLGAVAPGTGSKMAFGVDRLSRAPMPEMLKTALLSLLGAVSPQAPQE